MDSLPAGFSAPAVAQSLPRRGAFLRAILGEPLVHFLVLGGLLFGLWSAFGSKPAAVTRIVIPPGQMARAIATFTRINLRPPGAAELQQLAEQEISDEVYFREGMALGLDRDDEIIRRRIKQKLEFMTQDIAAQAVPSEAALQEYLNQHAQDFGGEPSLSFSQIYLNPARHKDIAADATRLRDQLNAGDGRLDYAALSDILPVPNDFEPTALHVISDTFGQDFATSLATLPPGHWVGPIGSGYGMHLVLVRTHDAGGTPELAQVHDAVLREWQEARRVALNQQAYAAMRAKYTVQVQFPPTQSAAAMPVQVQDTVNGD